MNRVLALGAVVLGAVACTGGSTEPAEPPPDTTPTRGDVIHVEVVGATFTYEPVPDSGVASRVEEVEFDPTSGTLPELEVREAPLAFAIRECIRQPDRSTSYVIQWRPPDGLDLPVTVTVSPGDAGGFFARRHFEVTLEEPGLFRIESPRHPLDLQEGDPDEDSVAAEHRDDANERPCRLYLPFEEYFDDQSDPDIAFRWSEERPVVDAPEGTLQWFAGQEGAVAQLVHDLLVKAGPDTELLPDRLWLPRNGAPEVISSSRQGPCWRIRSQWSTPAVSVRQQRGCGPRSPSSSANRVVEILDDAWEVTVEGSTEAVETFVASAEAIPLAGAETLGAVGRDFDPVADWDHMVATSEMVEIGRIPWGDGMIAIATQDGTPNSEWAVAGFRDDWPAWPRGGSGGIPIQRGVCVALIFSSSDESGFAVALWDDPAVVAIEVQRDDESWEPLEIVEVGSNRLALITDHLPQEGNISPVPPPFRGLGADGQHVACAGNT